MTEFETPLMRDISRLLTPIVIGLLMSFAIIMFCFFPINGMTVICNGWMETSSYSVGEWIVRSIQC